MDSESGESIEEEAPVIATGGLELTKRRDSRDEVKHTERNDM